MTASKNKVKKLVRSLHRWIGLASGILLLVVALTGSIMAFEEEGREHFQHDYYHLAQTGTERLPVDQLVDTFRVHYPRLKINSIRFKETKDAAFVFFTKERYVFMNPYTSQITADLPLSRDFFSVVRLIHTELYMGPVGKTIVHFNVLLFFIMCISGLILWWPRKWRFFRQAATVNLSVSSKRTNYDLHRVLGFYALPILLIICFTGLFMAFDTTKDLVAFITHNPAPEKDDPPIIQKPAPVPGAPKPKKFSVAQAYAYASAHYPGALETFLTPGTKETPIRVVMRYPYTVVRQQNTFYFNQWDGTLVSSDLYDNYSAYDKVARSNYNLHTGKIAPLGIFSKILYCLAALTAASLPITGLRIWLARKKKSPAKPKPAPAASTAPASPASPATPPFTV
jgi:uncharacterized iron-regulated membrane protein